MTMETSTILVLRNSVDCWRKNAGHLWRCVRHSKQKVVVEVRAREGAAVWAGDVEHRKSYETVGLLGSSAR